MESFEELSRHFGITGTVQETMCDEFYRQGYLAGQAALAAPHVPAGPVSAEQLQALMRTLRHEDRPGDLWRSTTVGEKAVALKVLNAYLAAPSASPVPAGGLTELQRTAPERIRLQISDDIEHHNRPFPDAHGDEVTWCADGAMSCEVEYVRADLARAAPFAPAQPATEQQASDEAEALGLLEVLYDAYESGTRCYEDPDDKAGYLGNAVRLSEDDDRRAANLLNRRRPRAVPAAAPKTGHDIYRTGDIEAPDEIRDRNGEVTLALCKRCGRAEVELSEPCNAPAPSVEAQALSLLREVDLALRTAWDRVGWKDSAIPGVLARRCRQFVEEHSNV